MAVLSLDIRSQEPYEGGREFGEAGAYERLDGTLAFAVDPENPHNREIVDLDLAARDARGLVRFSADFCLLQPVAPGRGNRRLLFEVLNRGLKLSPRMINHGARQLVPSRHIDPGDGFLFRHGWTVAWCGWQWDVSRTDALMGIDPPEALQGGRPIQGQVIVQFQPNEPCNDHLLSDRGHTPYPALTDDAGASLSVRDGRDGPRTVIPRERWRFARDEGGRPLPDENHVWLDGGFQPGRVYEVIYRTRRCPVVGAGLLAVRDTAAFLRHGAAPANPAAGRLDRAYCFGASQSGRFIRHFLYLGLNLDEQGRQVYDGLLPHIAGSRRGEFNHRFAQPSVQAAHGFGHLMPFSGEEQTDPRTGDTDGLFRRQRRLGGMPRVFSINTSTEYWRGDGSLLHTDLAGTRDVEPAAEERIYLFASAQHGSGMLPLTRVNAIDGSRGMHDFNVVDYAPLLRAALVNLDRWASEGVEPPPSSFPRLADGTAAPRERVLEAFRALPGATVPEPALLPGTRRLDLGPEAARGVGSYPMGLGEPYPIFVPSVDEDRNDVPGLRLPQVAVPVATYTGWNARDPQTGGAGEIMGLQGSTIPFAATADERRRTSDPRPSIAERYRDRDDYEARVRAEAERLAEQRLILSEDVELAVALALQVFDALAPTPERAAGD